MAVVIFISIIALIVFVNLTDKSKDQDFAEVSRGYFEISVQATGELIAENSVDIRGPNLVGNRQLRASPLKITDLIPEGTVVKTGDFVAEIDRSSYTNTLKDEQDELRTDQTNYDSKVLDSAVVLSQLRDDMRNQYYLNEEAEVTVQQSKYEPPATQRQNEIALDKSKRALEQKSKQYALKKAQIKAELQTLKLQVNTQQRVVDDLQAILASFTVRAPAGGMVIYKKDRMGQKIITGSSLNPWEPIVATLPDLSSMLSKMYISEIEINKVRKNMSVEITIDAFRDKNFTGSVYSIANIGEQLQNSDTKSFEVLARINDNDPMLRPSMTTSNKLIVKTYNDVTFVPNESVHAGVDSLPFVYTKDGKKQIVVLGDANDKSIIVEKGLEKGGYIWLTIPQKPENFKLAGTELIPEIRERVKELAKL